MRGPKQRRQMSFMWFKNLLVYRFTRPFEHSADELNTLLEPMSFTPCGAQDQLSMGWATPLGDAGSELIHPCNPYVMVCLKQQEKVLPAAVVKEFLEDKLKEIEANDGRRPGRKERNQLKDEILFDLLPRAFVRSRRTYAYIDTRDNLLVIDSPSHKRAEDLMSLLRDSLGSLPVVPLQAKNTAQHVMTDWLVNTAPANFEFGGECELKDKADESAVIRAKNQDLHSKQIQSHLESGMFVSKLALHWQGGIDFVIDDQLAIKRLNFDDMIRDKADDIHSDTFAEQFDADFSIMTAEIARLLPAVLEAFGGEAVSEGDQAA